MTSAIFTELDLTGIDLNESDPQSSAGITSKLTAAVSTGAPVLVTGLVNDSVPFSPMFVVVASDTIILPIGGYLTVDTTDDTITVGS